MANNSNRARVRIPYVPSLPSLPLYVADHLGIFHKYGLEPQLENKGADVPGVIGAVVSGQSDLTYVAYFAILATEIQRPGSCAVLQHEVDTPEHSSVYCLVARPDSGISSVADLAGKTLGLFGSGLFEAYAASLLKTYDVDPATVKTVALDAANAPKLIEALARKDIDALLTLEPIATVAVAQKVAVFVDRRPLTPHVLSNIPTGAALVSRKALDERPEFIRSINRALDEAVDYIRGHEAAIAPIYEKYGVISAGLGEALQVLHFWKSSEVRIPECQKYADYLADNRVIPGRIGVNALYPLRRARLDLGFTNESFSGRYGFSIIYGPRRYVGIGAAISDGRGRFQAIQKLNLGNGQPLLQQDIDGTYEVYPDGTGVAHIKATLPDGNVVDGTFDYTVLRAEQRGTVKLGVELQGVDRNPAIDFATGKPLEPPQIGVSWFQSIP